MLFFNYYAFLPKSSFYKNFLANFGGFFGILQQLLSKGWDFFLPSLAHLKNSKKREDSPSPHYFYELLNVELIRFT
jgi:hypothetical protein